MPKELCFFFFLMDPHQRRFQHEQATENHHRGSKNPGARGPYPWESWAQLLHTYMCPDLGLLIPEVLTAGRAPLQACRIGFLIPSPGLSLPFQPGPVTGTELLLTLEGVCKSILRGLLPRPLLWAESGHRSAL